MSRKVYRDDEMVPGRPNIPLNSITGSAARKILGDYHDFRVKCARYAAPGAAIAADIMKNPKAYDSDRLKAFTVLANYGFGTPRPAPATPEDGPDTTVRVVVTGGLPTTREAPSAASEGLPEGSEG
jgi:hypothetical protein